MVQEILAADVYKYIHAIAPFFTQEDYDNSGLLIGSGNHKISNLLLCMDITHNIIDFAIQNQIHCILCHHPVIFHGLKNIESGSVVYRLIENHITVIAAHTNLDAGENGIDDTLATALELQQYKVFHTSYRQYGYKVATFVPRGHETMVESAMALQGAGSHGYYEGCGFFTYGEGHFMPKEGANPYKGKIGQRETADEVKVEMFCWKEDLQRVIAAMKAAHPYEMPAYDVFENQALSREYGAGRVGSLATEMEPSQFINHVKAAVGVEHVRAVLGERPVKKVVSVCGCGDFLLEEAVASGADAFVSGDLRHQYFLYGKNAGITVIDAGHFHTEIIGLRRLQGLLQHQFPSLHITMLENENFYSTY